MRHLGWFLAAALPFMALPAWAMTVDDVTELLQRKVGEQVILEQMNAEGDHFELTTQQILDLKEAGASDDLLREMIRRGESPQADSVQDWADDYDSPSVSYNADYDPFGYYWYGWPGYFTYYYPFRWGQCGFYYAGWWNHRWWDGGLWANSSWTRFHSWNGWHGYQNGSWRGDRGRSGWDRGGRWGGTRGDHAWNRGSGASQGRLPDGSRYGRWTPSIVGRNSGGVAPGSGRDAYQRDRRWNRGGTWQAPSRPTPPAQPPAVSPPPPARSQPPARSSTPPSRSGWRR